MSSSSLAKLIAGSRGRDAGWMRRGRAWCAESVGELRTADQPRQFRRRRRLSGRLRVPLDGRVGEARNVATKSEQAFLGSP